MQHTICVVTKMNHLYIVPSGNTASVNAVVADNCSTVTVVDHDQLS